MSALCILKGGPLDGAAIANAGQPESLRLGLGMDATDYPSTEGGAMRLRYWRPVPPPPSDSQGDTYNCVTYYRWSDGYYRETPEPLPVS